MTAPAAPASPEPAGLATKPRMQIPAADSVVWLYALIGGLAAIHVSMLFGRSINWDEFWFYSQVEILARGEFLKPLQTIHTRFFYWWLPGMPGNEIDHIQIARGFMLACLAITTVAIYLCAEAFSDKRTALLATGLYLGSGYVLQHGASFRVDPIVTACLATGLAIAVRSRLSIPAILAFGAVIGLAAMVTIKFVLWAPAFAAVALWRWQDENWDWRYPLRWIVAGIVALVVFAALYWWHGTGTAGSDANAEAVRTLDRSAGKMFGFPGNPLFFMVIKGIAVSMPLIIAALMVPWRGERAPGDH
ncbi:MAG: glycosyltransferase family 39 protein [Pseudomonadota bacterium]